MWDVFEQPMKSIRIEAGITLNKAETELTGTMMLKLWVSYRFTSREW